MAFPERQIAGALAVLAIGVLVSLYSFFSPLFIWQGSPIPFLVKTPDSLVVELSAGDARQRGIYFVPKGTTVGDFLRQLQGALPAGFSPESAAKVLLTGSSLRIVRNAGEPPQCVVGEMRADQKIALGLPLDINRATAEELLLIPGIGEKTAVAILSFRQSRGRIPNLDELANIRGIKKKRLARLKTYFTIEEPRGE